MKAQQPHFGVSVWRPPFDEVKDPHWYCFRAPETPVQPLKTQFMKELKQLVRQPCDFTQGSPSWRRLFAVSSVTWIPAVVLCGVRWLCAVLQLSVTVCSLIRGWRMMYFFTTWTNFLVTAIYWALSLCSAFALLRPQPSTKHFTDDEDRPLPALLRLVEGLFALALGASFITCTVYWTAVYPTAKETTWVSYCEHISILPLFLMAIMSRIPYRLQHIWLLLLLILCYDILCCVVAFVPLTTWYNTKGYLYPVAQYQSKPVQAWLITAAFTVILTPLTYIIFWFALRFNNPEIKSS